MSFQSTSRCRDARRRRTPCCRGSCRQCSASRRAVDVFAAHRSHQSRTSAASTPSPPECPRGGAIAGCLAGQWIGLASRVTAALRGGAAIAVRRRCGAWLARGPSDTGVALHLHHFGRDPRAGGVKGIWHNGAMHGPIAVPAGTSRGSTPPEDPDSPGLPAGLIASHCIPSPAWPRARSGGRR